jgi:sugar lactone lactonase YvrE
MRKIIFLAFVLLRPYFLNAQLITTIAGNGIHANTGDGLPATAASINYPCGGVFDKFGNYYFGLGDRGCCVRKISPVGIITTVAGIVGSCGYSGDGGPAIMAKFKNVQAVTVDTLGNLYIADADFNNRIRKVDIATNIVSTIAGTGVGGFNGDGIPATSAQIYNPVDLCFDKNGNLFIADAANARVRKINTSGTITTVAGNGFSGHGGTNVPATGVPINPYGICFDNSGNLLIADWHSRVYKVDNTGIISYYVGNGINGYGGDGGLGIDAQIQPYHIAVDKYGNLFIAEYSLARIRIVNNSGHIYTVAGNGIRGYNGEEIAASEGELYSPVGIAIDSCNNLYVSDLDNYRIRKIIYPQCNYLSVSWQSLKSQISIYPNPSNELLNIDNVMAPTAYYLINSIGTFILQGNLRKNNNTVSLKSVPQGLYFLELVSDKNKTITKIIKQ